MCCVKVMSHVVLSLCTVCRRCFEFPAHRSHSIQRQLVLSHSLLAIALDGMCDQRSEWSEWMFAWAVGMAVRMGACLLF
jgi:hypothetical protein